MKKLIYTFALVSAIVSLNACGEKKEEKKELTVCDCLEDGKIKQTDECREIAGKAKADEIEKCN